MNKDVYVSAKHIQQSYKISSQTLRNWACEGKLEHVSCGNGGKRLYSVNHLRTLLGVTPINNTLMPAETKAGIIYARVSSPAQKQAGDLQRQIDQLQLHYPSYRLIQDVGSGLNFKRKGLLTLLDLVSSNMVSEIVVLHKDRLCRFGLELLEYVFKKAGVKLVVFNNNENAPNSSSAELADDIISITTVFVARHNGQRAAANRKRRREQQEQTQKQEDENGRANTRQKTSPTASTNENVKTSHFPNPKTTTNTQQVDWNDTLDL